MSTTKKRKRPVELMSTATKTWPPPKRDCKVCGITSRWTTDVCPYCRGEITDDFNRQDLMRLKKYFDSHPDEQR